MKVLLVGTGGVGEAIARIASDRPWLEKMVLSDYDVRRAREVARHVGGGRRFPVERVDAANRRQIVELARRHDVDVILNAVDPVFNEAIFEAAFTARRTYIDMAMTLSTRHPRDPHRRPGVKLGDYQFERAERWERRGLLALVGMGVEPGMADVFAKYAAVHLFDRVDEINVRDGANLVVKGHDFAPNFSIWTTIEECLNPPVVWERERGWFTTPTFSEPEVFEFPEGIGPIECVNVEHEEVLLVPRWVEGVKKVTFKYALGSDFIEKLKFLHEIGLDRVDPVKVRGGEVSPRDVVAAVVPDPATMGDKFVGRAIVGTWVIGRKDGKPREVFLYQMADAQETMRETGSQVVGWQTGFNPVLAMELLATGQWAGKGVLGPEAFDPDPYLALMDRYGIHHDMVEMEPGAHRPT